MEAAAALVSFVGLAGPVAQGLKSLYDFATDMKDCPQDIREMKTDLEFVEDLITQVVRQCNECDERLRGSASLTRAIVSAQESVEDLKKELVAYRVDQKRKRFKFAAKVKQTRKLRASLHRTKNNMLDFKNQLQSELLYDLRSMSQAVLRSVEKRSKDSGAHDSNFPKIMQTLESQAGTPDNPRDRVQAPGQPPSDKNGGLTDIKIVAEKLEHITDLLMETRISPSPTSSPSTIASPHELSDTSVTDSSQETTPSTLLNSRSIMRSPSQNTRRANIASEHPLLQFKDDQFRFLIAIIFAQRAKQQDLACQRASECLAAYPTPSALSRASPELLSQYFRGIGLQNVKSRQLIKFAQAYVKDPPQPGRLRLKAKCRPSEISHLPQIGPSSVNAWLVYCCEEVDVVTEEKKLLDYMEHMKLQPRTKCL